MTPLEAAREAAAKQANASELVERLREEADQEDHSTVMQDFPHCEILREAADALTAAHAQIAELQAEANGVTIEELQVAHAARQDEWCPDQKPDLSFRGNEMAGEVGEACNVIKKLERERHGWRGSRANKDQLADELADVVHTAVLCSITAGIDLGPAVVAKFNATSEKNGLVSRLRFAPSTGGNHD